MKNISALLLFLLMAATVLTLHWPASPINPTEEISGPVTYVVDGDTFHMQGKKIRVWGINSPEVEHPYYNTAKQAMAALVQGQIITCQILGQDKYERILGRCRDEGDHSLSSAMVRNGHAWDFTRYSNGAYRSEERKAKRDKLGLWALPPSP